jgi:OmcA/MtrC family decaheme c-type cytochrome
VAGSTPSTARPAETKNVNATTGITSYSYSPNTYVGDGEVMGHFNTLIHKIHNGASLAKSNYNYANVAFNNKAFSMLDEGQRMCTVCHDPALASKADQAYSKPSAKACGACHDGTNFRTGLAYGSKGKDHVGRAQADDSACVLCHSAAATKVDHRTVNLTTHNQAVTDGLVSFTYLIDSATVDASNTVKIVFAIQQQTAPSTDKTFATLPLSSNFTGGPSFLLAYALPQDGITAPADYNNLGRSQAQPASVSLASLIATLKPASKTGYYEATIANGFPAGAKMRSVGLQGYWTQVSPAAARHTISVVKTVTGDSARRSVVDATKCGSCHEWFEGHGGNRVIGKETGSAAELICVQCHVPGLATSGRRIPDTGANSMTTYAWTDADKFVLKEWGLMDSSGQFLKTTNISLDLPAVTNNFKDMIHGIHAGRDRVVPFQDARDRTTVKVLLDFRRMDFPGVLSNCEGCHKAGTYSSVPANGLVSVFESRNDAYVANPSPAGAGASLATANAKDVVRTPFGAACSSCHDNSAAKAHMQQNGARLDVNREDVGVVAESCKVCHGAGADFDAAKVHK